LSAIACHWAANCKSLSFTEGDRPGVFACLMQCSARLQSSSAADIGELQAKVRAPLSFLHFDRYFSRQSDAPLTNDQWCPGFSTRSQGDWFRVLRRR
jgi:hypothetical protein